MHCVETSLLDKPPHRVKVSFIEGGDAKGRSLSERCCYVWSEQTDLLKYFAKDWIQY